MSEQILFVGERRSEKAKTLGLTWTDGGLAAKPLFEALVAIGIIPTEHRFTNWFEGGKRVTRKHRGPIVAMGAKVQAALQAEQIEFIPIVHPAARGLIRRRDRYVAHVAEQLGGLAMLNLGRVGTNRIGIV